MKTTPVYLENDPIRKEMSQMAHADVVGALVQSYLAQDASAANRLIADDFSFTSPQDDHIDKATFFERGFPASGTATSRCTRSGATG